jgi:hypothetical protein
VTYRNILLVPRPWNISLPISPALAQKRMCLEAATESLVVRDPRLKEGDTVRGCLVFLTNNQVICPKPVTIFARKPLASLTLIPSRYDLGLSEPCKCEWAVVQCVDRRGHDRRTTDKTEAGESPADVAERNH